MPPELTQTAEGGRAELAEGTHAAAATHPASNCMQSDAVKGPTAGNGEVWVRPAANLMCGDCREVMKGDEPGEGEA